MQAAVGMTDPVATLLSSCGCTRDRVLSGSILKECERPALRQDVDLQGLVFDVSLLNEVGSPFAPLRLIPGCRRLLCEIADYGVGMIREFGQSEWPRQ